MLNLTKEEEELILSKRQKDEDSKPKMEGFLNRDLYYYESGNDCDLNFDAEKNEENETLFWLCDDKQIEIWKKKFAKHFKKVLPKGTRFVCYVIDGNECWFDDVNYGLEEMSESWAEKYLKNIKKIC